MRSAPLTAGRPAGLNEVLAFAAAEGDPDEVARGQRPMSPVSNWIAWPDRLAHVNPSTLPALREPAAEGIA
ncbi:MAG: hypothetical protein EXQ81_03735 [Thermoleophilia bacterium]|nr:hypothetical protein [Thermoleophilia bacterium]